MRRRDFIANGLSLWSGVLLAQGAVSVRATAAEEKPVPFQSSTVRELARARAAKPYRAPDSRLSEQLAKLNYDAYRAIRYVPDQALWRNDDRLFQLQFFHRGFLFSDRVLIYEVAEGHARQIAYRPDMFTFGGSRPAEGDIGFAGFRIHSPMNQPDYFDEVCAFLGASYFRAVAQKQGYGLSARGLSLKTGSPSEEFPAFRAFWIERPEPQAASIVVHALLDSESAAAAFRFTIRPGEATVFDVEMTLHPRTDIAEVGIATLTSMFYFDASDRLDIDDYRPSAHDSDGLLMWNGRGEQLWRPLANPAALQISAFADSNPRGFGLMQRKRDYRLFKDLEARYERRPGVWVEPIGNWGEGAISLVEIPTAGEVNDNIVVYWRPKEPLRAKGEYAFTYRLHWCWGVPWPSKLAQIKETRSGRNWDENGRLFVIEVEGGLLAELPHDAPLRVQVSSDRGELRNAVAQYNVETGGWRMSFELLPDDAPQIELRAQLQDEQQPLSETWVYRWTP